MPKECVSVCIDWSHKRCVLSKGVSCLVMLLLLSQNGKRLVLIGVIGGVAFPTYFPLSSFSPAKNVPKCAKMCPPPFSALFDLVFRSIPGTEAFLAKCEGKLLTDGVGDPARDPRPAPVGAPSAPSGSSGGLLTGDSRDWPSWFVLRRLSGVALNKAESVAPSSLRGEARKNP
eukprot:Hpha_TRINITY_DN10021_c0_g1::TRINITY_DN10021_c0_g1_i1::g.83955::m.83955